ncbi:BTAD domain-containing putative transcriptional regulator [Demequina sp. SYSU T00039]|uniref:BTAD domain-containing putative transcriptional regulator n=1 Tax=Demequina lignilytica TaxID=3051663 RepID=A0AAW7M7J7_9MICO|nr:MULTISPECIES: BTAD domain-containing putative transcriptional regulator [unclassified Demequina]MDN4478858.1 BTAD domain-containing putative transcriptional regulator [Demequina sp. SYSU T00039-1]MDN4488956.1 BTAD domain-containing putative transcriptional regulator [Demequina sp. SYSU T00039]
MRVSVLGGTGASAEPGVSPREHAVLEALLVARPVAASPERIAEAVWGDAPPATWPKQLQAAIGRLRKALGPDAIATTPAGYRIVPSADGGTVVADADEFEAAVARAREYAADGEHHRAVATLERALGLWRAAPYEDIADWPAARDEASRLAELREAATDDLLEARLAAGDHRAVAEGATALVAAEPYRERRWRCLALAQYRCERQADALETTRRAQRLLADELGVDPGAPLVALEEAILRHDEALLAPPEARAPSPDCPYRGLRPYEPQDAHLFHGRDQDVAAVLAVLDRTGFVTVTGPSGVGKSSLLRAGVIPALRRRGLDPILLGPGASPSDVAAGSRRRPMVLDDIGREFADRPRAAALAEALADAHAGGVRVILAVQSLQLDGCVAQPAIGALVGGGLHFMAPPTPDMIRAAVERPALRSGLSIEHGLVDVILHDAARVDTALPLLSYSLAATWERRDGGTLTIEAYEATGGLLGAIARAAERLYLNLGEAERDACRALMHRLVEVSTDGGVLLHPVVPAVAQATAARAAALARLVGARLVVAREDGYVLAHEALTREWPRLGAWLEQDAETSRIVAHLTEAATEWDRGDRNDDDLYRGARLAAALTWRDGSDAALTRVEREFLARSAAVAAAVADRERRIRRRSRGLRAWVAASSLALVALSLATAGLRGIAEERRQDAAVATISARVRDMATWARPVAALLAVEIWSRDPDDPRARAALFDSAAAHPDLLDATVLDGGGGLGFADLGGQGQVLVTGTGVTLNEPGSNAAAWTVAALDTWAADGRRDVAAAADGSRIAVLAEAAECPGIAPCGVLSSVDTATGRLLASAIVTGAIPTERSHPLQTQVDAAGSTVATVDSGDGAVEIRDLATLEPVGSIGVSGARTDEVALTLAPDGRLVIVQPGNVRLVDMETATEVWSSRLMGSTSGLSATVTRDGVLITAGAGAMQAVDLASGTTTWLSPLDPQASGPCAWMATDEAASLLYCADVDGAVSERDLATGELTGRVLRTQPEHAGALACGDGELAAFGSTAPVVTRWTTTGDGPVRRSIAQGQILLDGYSPSGTRLLTSTRRPDDVGWDLYTEFSTWDVGTGAQVRRYDGVTGYAWVNDESVVAFSFETRESGLFSLADGALGRTFFLAPSTELTLSRDRTMIYVVDGSDRPWGIDVATGAPETLTADVEGKATLVASSPDGRLVAISSVADDGTSGVQVFETATGAPVSTFTPELWKAAINDDGVVAAGAPGGVSTLSAELEPRRRFDMPGQDITVIRFSADGDLFVVGDDGDGSMVFDTATTTRIAGPLASDSPYPWPVALRSDGLELAVTTGEGIDVWSLDPEILRRAACASAGRDLTAQEWETHLAAFGPWRSTCGFGRTPPTASS